MSKIDGALKTGPISPPIHRATSTPPLSRNGAKAANQSESARTHAQLPGTPPSSKPQNASIRAEQVTAHTTTPSMEVSRSDDSGAMMALRKLSLRGPPVARGSFGTACDGKPLSLTPEIYNLLVFGETEDAAAESTAPPAIGAGHAACALPPPAPPQSL